ncbi:MAG: DUF523 domain-containing protein [Planctomycetaceae bacterium]|nr:MAG: DUF523 domain-containing protein [Planctomycetaceae bacterium]
MIIVSACLLGVKCRYDGGSTPDKKLQSMASEVAFIPVCPEQLGGLPTPRVHAQIVDGNGEDVINGLAKVIDSNNRDLTGQFLKGAEEVREIARLMKVSTAIMKEESPSCGVRFIRKSGVTKEGMGVTSALLMREGIHVISSDEISEEYVRYCSYRK